MAFDEKPGFVPHGEADRADGAIHATVAQPGFGRAQQRLGDRCVLGLEKAPKAHAGAEALFGGLFESEVIDMRRDAPGDDAVADREEQLRLAMFEPGVLSGVDQAMDFGLEGRHPVGIVGVEPEGQIDEGLGVRLGFDRADRYLGAGHGRDWRACRPCVKAAAIMSPS